MDPLMNPWLHHDGAVEIMIDHHLQKEICHPAWLPPLAYITTTVPFSNPSHFSSLNFFHVSFQIKRDSIDAGPKKRFLPQRLPCAGSGGGAPPIPSRRRRRRRLAAGLVSEPVGPAADPVVVGQLVDAADGRQRVVLVVDHGLGHHLDVVRGEGVDAGLHLRGGHPAAVGQHLPADVLADGGAGVGLRPEVGLQRPLRPGHLGVRHLVAEADEVVRHGVGQVVQVAVPRRGLDAEQARVLVLREEGAVAGGAPLLGDVLAELGGRVGPHHAAGVPGAEQRLHEHQGHALLRGPPARLEGQGHLGRLHRVIPDALVRAAEDARLHGGLHAPRGRRRQPPERLLG
mmetsp:Transcript_2402/g.4071  ORF Transcript_2402/g.4071 Transcript_2402/m.4071 type:complete len:343 (-) Transcript_2402:256-1284(-)